MRLLVLVAVLAMTAAEGAQLAIRSELGVAQDEALAAALKAQLILWVQQVVLTAFLAVVELERAAEQVVWLALVEARLARCVKEVQVVMAVVDL